MNYEGNFKKFSQKTPVDPDFADLIQYVFQHQKNGE